MYQYEHVLKYWSTPYVILNLVREFTIMTIIEILKVTTYFDYLPKLILQLYETTGSFTN